jgi:hypothetical protein
MSQGCTAHLRQQQQQQQHPRHIKSYVQAAKQA